MGHPSRAVSRLQSLGDVRMRRPIEKGFTLVELLVVIAIIGVLVALLLPAVQAAREAARRIQCSNHLKQFGIAAHSHLDAYGLFPTNGWGWWWIGDPDRGVDRRQPGGWIFNLLPYLEQENVYDLQSGLPFQSTQRLGAAKTMLETPIAMFNCPSRRPAALYPTGECGSMQNNPNFSATVTDVARSDYASNGGSVAQDAGGRGIFMFYGPKSIADAESHEGQENWEKIAEASTGVFYPGSEITVADIEDGTSHTYLFGEKTINPDYYTNGLSLGDNEYMFTGDNGDITRWAGPKAVQNQEDCPMWQDRPGIDLWTCFGSIHPGGVNMVFCDGNVRSIDYDIDLVIHGRLADRRDGLPVDPDSY